MQRDPRLNIAELAEIHNKAFTKGRSWSAIEFGGLLQHPGVCVISQSECFVMGRLVLDELEILTVACAPSHQNLGYARAVVVKLLDKAACNGGLLGFLEVAADNMPAISLYKSLGFVQVGLREGYYKRSDDGYFDALVFSKKLI